MVLIKRKKTNYKTQESYSIYKEKRKILKNYIIDAKGKAWKEFDERKEKNTKENQKLFYKIRNIYRKLKRLKENLRLCSTKLRKYGIKLNKKCYSNW